ncbi:MAG: helix-turn-helix domain-containing protein [Acidobacteriaceae bacterium]
MKELRARKTALTAKEFAPMLAVSERQITAMVKAGRMPGFKIGGAVRIDPGEAADWLEERRTR